MGTEVIALVQHPPQVPTKRDLEDALQAVLAGKAPPVAETKGFGCPLPEPAKPKR